jgi:hypothetical protein
MPQIEMSAGSQAQPRRRNLRTTLAGMIGALRRASRRVGQAEARAIMSGFYFVALGAVALVMGRRRKALLIPAGEPAAWRPVAMRSPGEHSAKQY